MKNAAFIEWDKQLNRNEQRPRGVFFRQKKVTEKRFNLATSQYVKSIKSAIKVHKHASSWGKTSEGMSGRNGAGLTAFQSAFIEEIGFFGPTVTLAPDIGKSNVLNPIEGIAPSEVVQLLASMVNVELDPDQEHTAIQLVLALPDSKTIRDFIDTADIENAARLGLLPEKIEAIKPLIDGLKKFLD